jgi:acetyltransferase-like isoleucine patch superfamily enzyme
VPDMTDRQRAASRKWRMLFELPWKYWGPVLELRNVMSGSSVRRFRKRNVGKSSYVDPSVQIFGWEQVSMGDNSVLSEGTWLNANSRNGHKDHIVIGNYCHIGRRNYFSSGESIVVKDFAFTGLDCHFLGCGHKIDSPLLPYISTGLTAGAPIEIGINCWLTTAVTVLEGVRIGHGSVVGTRSVVVEDLPPFSLAIGSPCRVVKRFDFRSNTWIAAADFTEAHRGYMPTESEYLTALLESGSGLMPSLHASSGRFGWLR